LETANTGEIDWQEQDKKDCKKYMIHYGEAISSSKSNFTVLSGMLMTASDVSAISKPWEIQHKMAKMVADEFFDQGDLEKLRLNTQPIVSVFFTVDLCID